MLLKGKGTRVHLISKAKLVTNRIIDELQTKPAFYVGDILILQQVENSEETKWRKKIERFSCM